MWWCHCSIVTVLYLVMYARVMVIREYLSLGLYNFISLTTAVTVYEMY